MTAFAPGLYAESSGFTVKPLAGHRTFTDIERLHILKKQPAISILE